MIALALLAALLAVAIGYFLIVKFTAVTLIVGTIRTVLVTVIMLII